MLTSAVIWVGVASPDQVMVPGMDTMPVRIGASIVGVVLKTALPVPVSSVRVPRRFALEADPRNVPMPELRPAIPEIGRLVPLVSVMNEGTPRFGVTSVGELASTMLPVPVTELESVTPP